MPSNRATPHPGPGQLGMIGKPPPPRWLRIGLLALCVLGAAGARATQPPPLATPPGQPPVVAAPAPSSEPPAPTLDPKQALRDSQAAIGRVLADHTLLDREGKRVRLADYRGKPLIVSFIYTGCFQVCPTTTRSLQESVRTLYKTFRAHSFNVISIGFNQPSDSPQSMRAFASQHRISEPNWNFLSPPPATVHALMRDFGFSVLATPSGFDHLLGVTVVDAEGRVYAQVYGERMTPDQLGEPLRLLLRGAPMPQRLSLSELIERARIICTVYDPDTGTYRTNYGLIIEIAGGVTFMLAVAWFFALELRNRWRVVREKKATAKLRDRLPVPEGSR